VQITTDGRAFLSPSDLTTWATCEWAFLRRLDVKLGRSAPLPDEHDDMLDRTARLGDQHELDYLEILKRAHDVVEFDRPAPPQYEEAAAAARAAMRDGADVLYQPSNACSCRAQSCRKLNRRARIRTAQQPMNTRIPAAFSATEVPVMGGMKPLSGAVNVSGRRLA